MSSTPAFARCGGDPDAYAALAASAMEHLPCGVLVLSASGVIEFFNGRLFDLLPIQDADLRIGMSVENWIHLIGPHFGWNHDRQKRVIASHYEWMGKNEATILNHYHEDGSVLGVGVQPRPEGGAVLTFQDSSNPSREASEIRKFAFRDPLTGLLNRRALEERFEQIPDDGQVVGNALLLIDLDHFKTVNDSYGHATGDLVLTQVVRRIAAILPTDDLLFRLGGDELVVWPQPVRDGAAQVIATDIVRVCAEPVRIEGQTILIGASVGIAHAVPGDRGGDLLGKADVALYEAKHDGRGGVVTYAADMSTKWRQEVRRQHLS